MSKQKLSAQQQIAMQWLRERAKTPDKRVEFISANGMVWFPRRVIRALVQKGYLEHVDGHPNTVRVLICTDDSPNPVKKFRHKHFVG